MDYILRTIKLRDTHNGASLKPFIGKMDGLTLLMHRGWKCEYDERYAGEEAWIIKEYGHPISWIASGDLIPLDNIEAPLESNHGQYGQKENK